MTKLPQQEEEEEQHQAEITAGRDCGLAEWIIDDSCLVCICVCVGLRLWLLTTPFISCAALF